MGLSNLVVETEPDLVEEDSSAGDEMEQEVMPHDPDQTAAEQILSQQTGWKCPNNHPQKPGEDTPAETPWRWQCRECWKIAITTALRAEREACAKVAEVTGGDYDGSGLAMSLIKHSQKIAAAIRAREKKDA